MDDEWRIDTCLMHVKEELQSGGVPAYKEGKLVYSILAELRQHSVPKQEDYGISRKTFIKVLNQIQRFSLTKDYSTDAQNDTYVLGVVDGTGVYYLNDCNSSIVKKPFYQIEIYGRPTDFIITLEPDGSYTYEGIDLSKTTWEIYDNLPYEVTGFYEQVEAATGRYMCRLGPDMNQETQDMLSRDSQDTFKRFFDNNRGKVVYPKSKVGARATVMVPPYPGLAKVKEWLVL